MKRPLKGTRVVITRSMAANGEWAAYFKKLGAIVVRFPTIETVPVLPNARIKKILKKLDDHDAVVFTSAEGVRATNDIMQRLSLRVRMPAVAAVGEKTAEAVRKAGWHVHFVPSRADGRALAKELDVVHGAKIVLLRANIAPKDLSRALRSRGARVTDLAVYRTVSVRTRPDDRFSKLLMGNKLDYLTFASPSAVRGFVARVKGSALAMARLVPSVALGPSVVKALRAAGFKKIRMAKSADLKAVAQAMRSRK